MGDDEKSRPQTIIDQPSMTTIVTKEYLIPPFTEVVIHKKFFMYWTFFMFIVVSGLWAIGLWTNWYWVILTRIGMVFWDNWWLFPVIVVVLGLAIYINRPRKRGGAKTNKTKSGKSSVIAVGILVAFILIALVAAAAVNTFLFPQNANVQATVETPSYIDNVFLPNNTAIVWGDVVGGTSYQKQLAVFNNGTTVGLVSLIVSPPIDWTETWAVNGTVLNPQQWANGTLTLTVPITVMNGTYSWNSYLDVN